MADRDRTGDSLWLLLPEQIRTLPADLAAVAAGIILTCVVVLVPGVNETPLRVILGLPAVLFLPGYAFVSALFPEAGPSQTEGESDNETSASESADAADEEGGLLGSAGTERGIEGIERVALSFGLSIAIVPLLGLLLNFTPWGIRLVPILVTLSVFTLAMVGIGAVRRQALPEPERFRVPYRTWFAAGREELFEPDSWLDGALNVLLVLSLLIALGAVGFAVVVPPEGEQFTEFYLLTENEDGDLVASDYPTEFALGESKPVVVGVGNNEGAPVEYSVVVQLQEVEIVDNETRVRQREELDRFSSPSVADGEDWRRTHELQPTLTGERLRVQYLLYRDGVPADPTRDNAYRTLHLWVNVTAQST